MAVVHALSGDDTHPTADVLLARVRQVQPTLSQATVYKVIGELVEMGVLQPYSFGDARLHFDTRTDEHAHLYCQRCGRLMDCDEVALPDPLSLRQKGWPLVRTELWFVVDGCPFCQAAYSDLVSVHAQQNSMKDQGGVASMAKALEGTKTLENLKTAFAGEAQANRRYLYFARQADIEGRPDVAGLFRDVSEGETGHAFGHLDFLKSWGDPVTGEKIGTTEQNLKSAVAGETYEYTEMYPGFARVARDEGFDDIADWLETLARAEKAHAARFQKGLESLAS